jgi:hypothetical protein
MRAACQCQQLTADLPASSLFTIACHCVDCQRRTGAPFGVLAYYRHDQVNIEGEAKSYKRISAEGHVVQNILLPKLWVDSLSLAPETAGSHWNCYWCDCGSDISTTCVVSMGAV